MSAHLAFLIIIFFFLKHLNGSCFVLCPVCHGFSSNIVNVSYYTFLYSQLDIMFILPIFLLVSLLYI